MFDQDFFRALFTASAFGSILFFAIVKGKSVHIVSTVNVEVIVPSDKVLYL